MTKLDLAGKWHLRAVNPQKSKQYNKRKIKQWMPATVPGTVHTDLMHNKFIPDPYYRTNELDVQWVDSLGWEYSREFIVDRDIPGYDKIELVAEGLDTFATIFLNGEQIAVTDNMFLGYRFDIKRHLRRGKNKISVLFDSPELRAKELEQVHEKLFVSLESHRVFVRKAQYSFGWDWGPKLATSGIWKNIRIEYYNRARLRDPFVKIVSVDEQEAVVDIYAEVDRTTEEPLNMSVAIGDGDRILERTVKVEGDSAYARLVILRPRLWFPNGYGEQHLYTAELNIVSAAGEAIDRRSVTFGIRTVRLIREPDDAGESFTLEVNGIPVYCKGANWIPADNFIPRITASKYETLLRRAREAHMNMIRVWGGGIYEQDIFYELCDRLGLMVWQDFMFACGEYPEHADFIAGVEKEAVYNIKRLRNHPSIVLWCGNNECEYLFCLRNIGCTPDDMKGAVIFRDVLKTICERTDGTRPYWRSSPFGTGHPNDTSNGNHHQWMCGATGETTGNTEKRCRGLSPSSVSRDRQIKKPSMK
jgi:beta-mannosidase